jgi:hypothetical protein
MSAFDPKRTWFPCVYCDLSLLGMALDDGIRCGVRWPTF